jgi:2-oxoglutarate ferredoxin oxidoreductase subunit alpha
VFTSGWAVYLSQALQTAAIVLSDQFTGQSTAVVSSPRRHRSPAKPGAAAGAPAAGEPVPAGDFLRYRITDSGVSELAFPGQAGRRFTADGLEHNEHGTPSAADTDHRRQLAKRRHKLESFSFGDDWAEIAGEGELALISFGSSTAVIREAAAHLAQRGHAAKTIALRLLAPLQTARLAAALDGCRQLFVIEQNESAQLYHYLRSELPAGLPMGSCARPGPVPLNSIEVANHIVEALAS